MTNLTIGGMGFSGLKGWEENDELDWYKLALLFLVEFVSFFMPVFSQMWFVIKQYTLESI